LKDGLLTSKYSSKKTNNNKQTDCTKSCIYARLPSLRHNNGHVTKSQFRQCLTMLELHCTEPEMIALEAKFCNDTGFNYLAFLDELQPVDTAKFMYQTRLEEIRQTNARKSLPELNAQKDLESVLLKIKTKVGIGCLCDCVRIVGKMLFVNLDIDLSRNAAI